MTANVKASVKPETQRAANSGNEESPGTGQNAKVISHPNDIATLVMAQVNAVNSKKDDLTIAVKQLTDITQQLVQAYAGHMNMIGQLNRRLEELEDKTATAS